MRLRPAVQLVVVVVAYTLAPLPLASQAVQAVMGTATTSTGSILAVQLRLLRAHSKVPSLPDAESAAIDSVIDIGLNALASLPKTSDYNQYQARLKALEAQYDDIVVAISPAAARAAGPVPAAFTLKNVAFTIGYEISTGDGISTTGDFAVATNLLGATTGAVFDALGSQALKDYFTKNLAIGTGIPTSSRAHLSAQIGLGLGSYEILGATLWPSINFEATDTADSRTPAALRALDTAQASWSAPTIAVAIVLPDSWLTKIKVSHAGLIPVIGVRVPEYYPGDPLAALAALFTAKRSNYRRAGHTIWQFGLVLPLVRTDQPDATTSP